ncbi:MAG: ABC transporter permease [Candidatus Paracaedimonas acanthamoebae]|uniref:ABC transporter permease n=1 Tax=Candidatus Paracaedimonas acanthamoebae TaxID=244581 RepID=A0A8J7TT91_9PROT|nr:ABC transporter permease [Candidatus Paracaedimonas acanthamoebae]
MIQVANMKFLSFLNPKFLYFTTKESTLLLWKYRSTIFEMAKGTLFHRYAGQVLGPFWAIFHPLFITCLYLFIYGVVFKTRIGGTTEMPLSYMAYFLSGLLPWLSMNAGMNGACVALTSNSSLVKRVIFQIEILPVKEIFASLFAQGIGTIIFLIYVFLTHGSLFATYLLFPLVLSLQIMLMIGLGNILAAIGIFFRDIKDIVLVFFSMGIYLLPVAYIPTWVPSIFRPVLYCNPFSYMIWCYQDMFYYGRFEHPYAWIVFPFMSILSFVFGFKIFRKLKPQFGNFL